MFRSCLLFGGALFLTLLVTAPVRAQEFEIDEAVGYVNEVQTNIFNPGDTLTGASRAHVHAGQDQQPWHYYVRARLVAFSGNVPVTDWVYDDEYVGALEQVQLVPPVSQYEVPVPNFSSDYTYEVQLRYATELEGGPPVGTHYTLDTESFFFTY